MSISRAYKNALPPYLNDQSVIIKTDFFKKSTCAVSPCYFCWFTLQIRINIQYFCETWRVTCLLTSIQGIM